MITILITVESCRLTDLIITYAPIENSYSETTPSCVVEINTIDRLYL